LFLPVFCVIMFYNLIEKGKQMSDQNHQIDRENTPQQGTQRQAVIAYLQRLTDDKIAELMDGAITIYTSKERKAFPYHNWPHKEKRKTEGVITRACINLMLNLAKHSKHVTSKHFSYILGQIPQDSDSIEAFSRSFKYIKNPKLITSKNISKLLKKCAYGNERSLAILDNLKDLDNFEPKHLIRIIKITPYKLLDTLAEQLPYERLKKEKSLDYILDTMRGYCFNQQQREELNAVFRKKLDLKKKSTTSTPKVLCSKKHLQRLEHIAKIA
jgi:hypothetical protein